MQLTEQRSWSTGFGPIHEPFDPHVYIGQKAAVVVLIPKTSSVHDRKKSCLSKTATKMLSHQIL